MITTLIAATLAIPCPQDPSTGTALSKEDAARVEQLHSLRSTQKAMLVARVRNKLAHAFPLYQRILSMQVDTDELPEAAPAPVFSSQRWTDGAYRERTPIDTRSAEYRKVTADFARTPFLDDMHAYVTYDWCRGAIVCREEGPLDYTELFENMLRGYAPGVDHVIARIQQELDDDERTRKVAHWFGHHYADRQQRYYPDVTLYDAWYSGEVVEVPDVDAIPYAHVVLERPSVRTPISGRVQSILYEAIKIDALGYRKYRTLREAAAAAYVCADPRMDRIYARLVMRFHYLYATLEGDVTKLREILSARDRESLLDDVDGKMKDTESGAYERYEEYRKRLEALAKRTRAQAIAELEFFVGR